MIGGGVLRRTSVVAMPPTVTTAKPPSAANDPDDATATTAPPASATGTPPPEEAAVVMTARPRKGRNHGGRMRGGVGFLRALLACSPRNCNKVWSYPGLDGGAGRLFASNPRIWSRLGPGSSGLEGGLLGLDCCNPKSFCRTFPGGFGGGGAGGRDGLVWRSPNACCHGADTSSFCPVCFNSGFLLATSPRGMDTTLLWHPGNGLWPVPMLAHTQLHTRSYTHSVTLQLFTPRRLPLLRTWLKPSARASPPRPPARSAAG